MKRTANLWKDSTGVRGIVMEPTDPKADIKSTPLYTLHDVADFIRGLYFDENFIKGWDKSVFTEIADKLEEENEN
jgi:hypothetical protein